MSLVITDDECRKLVNMTELKSSFWRLYILKVICWVVNIKLHDTPFLGRSLSFFLLFISMYPLSCVFSPSSTCHSSSRNGLKRKYIFPLNDRVVFEGVCVPVPLSTTYGSREHRQMLTTISRGACLWPATQRPWRVSARGGAARRSSVTRRRWPEAHARALCRQWSLLPQS